MTSGLSYLEVDATEHRPGKLDHYCGDKVAIHHPR